MSKRVIFIGVALSMLFTPTTIAAYTQGNEDTVALSRYIEVSTDVDRQQRNPLQAVISIAYPPNISTVRQAISYTISSTGYTMNDLSITPEETRIMYTLNLPEVHRKFEHVKVINILQTLVGDAFISMVDPINRKVAFKPVVKLNNQAR